MGGAGGRGRRVALADAYDGRAASWDREVCLVYRPLAVALVRSSPVPLAGGTVLDVGSGTGAVAEAAEAAGASVVAVDRSLDMLAFATSRRPLAGADVAALPFRDEAFDAALAGFVLNHLPPLTALREMARVVRPGGVVVASTWAGGGRDPVKAAIDDVLHRWGWRSPDWYRRMMADVLPVSGDLTRLSSAARAAGLVDVAAAVRREDVGVRHASTAVAYRLATPQIAPWLARLDSPTKAQLIQQACNAVSPIIEQWRPAVVLLAARVDRQTNRRACRSNAAA